MYPQSAYDLLTRRCYVFILSYTFIRLPIHSMLKASILVRCIAGFRALAVLFMDWWEDVMQHITHLQGVETGEAHRGNKGQGKMEGTSTWESDNSDLVVIVSACSGRRLGRVMESWWDWTLPSAPLSVSPPLYYYSFYLYLDSLTMKHNIRHRD